MIYTAIRQMCGRFSPRLRKGGRTSGMVHELMGQIEETVVAVFSATSAAIYSQYSHDGIISSILSMLYSVYSILSVLALRNTLGYTRVCSIPTTLRTCNPTYCPSIRQELRRAPWWGGARRGYLVAPDLSYD